MIPVGKTGHAISLYHLAYISINDFEKVSGKHLKFTDRIGFKLAQRELRKGIAEDGTIQSKKMKKSLAKVTGGEYGFHAGGFVLGFFLGLIGVIIAYVISDDYKRNRVKWAWIGWGIFLVAYIALLIALL